MSTERTCTFEACIDPEEVGCNRGHLRFADCEHWVGGKRALLGRETTVAEVHLEEGTPGANPVVRLPWTGNSFGLRDAEFVTACNPTSLIGVVGPYNAGKTTLLTLIYLLIRSGESLSPGSFAGSASLLGWENLADKLEWRSGDAGPTFPAHTSRSGGRRPGLLHLAFRDAFHIRRDFLLTDPPGEWFSLWAQRDQAPGTEGARWIHRHADRFVLLADRAALASPERGKARDSLRDLARRVSEGLGGRPIAIVWTKSDLAISQQIEEDLMECFSQELPGHAEFRVQLRFGNERRDQIEDPCVALMNWMFSPSSLAKPVRSLPVLDHSDAFLAYRGRK